MNWICRTPALHMPTSIQMIGIPQIIANLKVVTPYIYFGSQHCACGWLPYALKIDNYQHMIVFIFCEIAFICENSGFISFILNILLDYDDYIAPYFILECTKCNVINISILPK